MLTSNVYFQQQQNVNIHFCLKWKQFRCQQYYSSKKIVATSSWMIKKGRRRQCLIQCFRRNCTYLAENWHTNCQKLKPHLQNDYSNKARKKKRAIFSSNEVIVGVWICGSAKIQRAKVFNT